MCVMNGKQSLNVMIALMARFATFVTISPTPLTHCMIDIHLLNTDKHQSLVQVDTVILGVCNQACPKYPK